MADIPIIGTFEQAGMIEEHFEVFGRRYVRERENLRSNYNPVLSNHHRTINDPNEQRLMDYIGSILFD
jgi:hypothetical protein